MPNRVEMSYRYARITTTSHGRGLSWAVGEVSEKDLRPGEPLKLTFASTEDDPITLSGQLYLVHH
jgi:hypothetical protein